MQHVHTCTCAPRGDPRPYALETERARVGHSGASVVVGNCQVDPQGGVTYQDEMVERDGKPEEQGQSWQEAGVMGGFQV